MESKIYQANVIMNDCQTLVYVLAFSPENAKEKIQQEMKKYYSTFGGFYNSNLPSVCEDVVICWN